MPEIRIGCSPVPPHRRSYFDRFSFGEISQTWMDPVRPQRLRSMRKLMKPDFELVVTAWRWLTQDPLDERGAAPLGLNKAHTGMLQVTDENRQIWALVAQQLRASRAHSVLLKTPNTFGPSKTNRTALTQFVKEIIQPGDLQVIWEPRGIWDYEDALEQAQESGVLLASDPFTDGTFREDDLLRLIDFVDEHDEAVTLVVRGDDRERVASRILRLLETDTGLGEEEVTLDDEAAAVPMASVDDDSVWDELDDDSAWDNVPVEEGDDDEGVFDSDEDELDEEADEEK
jgi:hypothetical protein